ncbi:MAG: phage tail protein [Chloroflexi bacterium]|nr:phage tail protein [Chloroflexota bacterium]MBK6709775.1 phage tail protein [Chloroflexota bacterium]MBK7179911.1 phage tail protein [Chloroflexota bacterium]MBK7918617.1 phage tail protein [Chloroflexota bacterium]
MTLESMRKEVNPGFRFVVDIAGISHGVFTECTLPSIDWDVEEVKEGGLNTYIHQLPGRRKSARITLKNGVGTSALMDWYIDTMNESFTRRKITVKLLDAKNKLSSPLMTWDIEAAYPVKWSGPQLNSGDNTIAIQTLEFACGSISMTRSSGAAAS